MKKRFGIDIDGTVTCRPDDLHPYLNKAFQLNLPYEDVTQYELYPFVNISREDLHIGISQMNQYLYRISSC